MIDFETEKTKFIKLFQCENSQFQLTKLIDGFGFSIKKEIYKNNFKYISLITVYLLSEDILEPKPLISVHMRAYYGESTPDGVIIRDKYKISDPVDIVSDKYVYSIFENKLFIKNKEISGCEILSKFYYNHIKSTRIIRGLWVRTKLFFWRIALFGLFKLFSNSFHYILLLISGDRYTYEPLFSQEKLNGRIISASLKELINFKNDYDDVTDKNNMEEKGKKNMKIEFFGHKLDYWPIITYSIINLSLYSYFYYINFKPRVLVKIIDNSFLTLLYVVISLWLLISVSPYLLRKLIRINSKISFELKYKQIKI